MRKCDERIVKILAKVPAWMVDRCADVWEAVFNEAGEGVHDANDRRCGGEQARIRMLIPVLTVLGLPNVVAISDAIRDATVDGTFARFGRTDDSPALAFTILEGDELTQHRQRVFDAMA